MQRRIDLRLCKVGSSVGVILPKLMLKQLNLDVGSVITIAIDTGET